jgi:hypothetical protein
MYISSLKITKMNIIARKNKRWGRKGRAMCSSPELAFLSP